MFITFAAVGVGVIQAFATDIAKAPLLVVVARFSPEMSNWCLYQTTKIKPSVNHSFI